MKRVLIALAALIGAAVVVAIIGALLPQDHTASRRAQYRESPEVLWAVITDAI
jgi:hypothetical protein